MKTHMDSTRCKFFFHERADYGIFELGFVRLKTVLARGMEKMSDEDKKELIKFLLEH